MASVKLQANQPLNLSPQLTSFLQTPGFVKHTVGCSSHIAHWPGLGTTKSCGGVPPVCNSNYEQQKHKH